MHIRLFTVVVASLCVAFAGGCAAARDTEELKAIFDSGVAAYDAGRYDEAFRIFQSIDDEDVAAMRNEGLMLRKGQGTAKDPQAAAEMLERAADAGLPTAQYDLAEMLLDGELGKPDPREALPWLTSAAAAHHPLAEYRLGLFYEQGYLVDKNLNTARNLYTAAAEAGVRDAKERLVAMGASVPETVPSHGGGGKP